MAFTCYAQTFGLKAGLNLSKIKSRFALSTLSITTNVNPGFHIGPTAEIPIYRIFFRDRVAFFHKRI